MSEDDAELAADDMPELPPCRCIDMGDGAFITNNCPLHCPVLGLLTEKPVRFTGLLSVLNAGRDGGRR